LLINPLIVTNGTTYYYHSQFLEESFSFFPRNATINWSIRINATSLLGLNLSYVLALPNGSPLPSVAFFPSRTTNNFTTYYIPLEGDLYALVVVPHVFASFQVSSSGTILLLQFPPFNTSFYYDPSIGLAKLLGGAGAGAGENPSSNEEPLIIGVIVGGSVALLFVFGVSLLGLLAARWKQMRRVSLLTKLSQQQR